MKIKANLKPSPTRQFKLALLVILLGVIFYLSYEGPRYNSPPNPRDVVTGELQGMETLRWGQFKIGPKIPFETDAALDHEIVTGTTNGGWRADIVPPNFTWEAGSPTPTGGVIIFKGDSFWSPRKYKLIRTPATLNSPAYWE